MDRTSICACCGKEDKIEVMAAIAKDDNVIYAHDACVLKLLDEKLSKEKK